MIRKLYLLFFLLFSLSGISQSGLNNNILFDKDWKFFLGGVLGGENVSYDDSKWRLVQLPHDWSIENLNGMESPFSKNAISQVSGGFTVGGTGWYRKKFFVARSDSAKQIHILFEGIYMNSDVWINGQHVGNHPYGYTSFWYNITPYIQFGKENCLAVEVKNEGQNSRWYSGSGIYRHVWLKTLSPAHLAEWGTHITTSKVSDSSASIHIETQIENAGDTGILYTVYNKVSDQKGKMVRIFSSEIYPGKKEKIVQDLNIHNPLLWSVDFPNLYYLKTEIYHSGQLIDQLTTRFGIRKIQFDKLNGFQLNGIPIKLKGGCIHEDHGPLGSASYDRAEERRVALMKASGFNAIRCAHNPPAPAFLDFCDSLGMLVIDESFDMWEDGKNPYDYHLYFDDWWKKDIESMVFRDRNHPSIIMWSIGNEIPNKERLSVAQTGKNIATQIRSLDSGRPITSAVNGVQAENDPYTSVLDIVGYNYGPGNYVTDHQKKPDRLMMGTESYALEAFDYWMQVTDHPYVLGDFVWTGFDYIGEASIGWRGYMQEKDFYPWNLAFCGDIDICGWKRPQSYYRDALWKLNQLTLFVTPPKPSFPLNPKRESWSKWNWEDVVADWNWEGYQGKLIEVKVYSSCEEVELFLNGHSLGKKPTNRTTRFIASWNIPYTKGYLKAVGYREGKVVNESALETAGKATKIILTADRLILKANGQDLSYITVEIKDANNILQPKSDRLMHFSISGPGLITGVGNADPTSIESYQKNMRKTWRGKCLVVVKSMTKTGEIILKISTKGLP